MPRFYFHVFNGTGETHDEEGTDLPDADMAYDRALSGIRSILREELGRGLLDFNGMIRVTDQQGQLVFEVPFDMAVEIRHGDRRR